MILGDYHTHTRFSHGKGTIEQNVKEAREKGLKEIAITDHGLRHIAFGMRRNDIFKMRKIIDRQNELYPDIRVLFGVEANIYCSEGLIDLKNKDFDYFDVINAGLHKGVWPKNVRQLFSYYGRVYKLELFKSNSSDVRCFTSSYIKAIKSGKIDVITHLTYHVPVDVSEVGKAASDYGVIIELNGKNVRMSDEEINILDNLGVSFIVNSDAHSPDRVGDFSVPMAVVERLGINKNKIVNWDKTPEFLSSKRK